MWKILAIDVIQVIIYIKEHALIPALMELMSLITITHPIVGDAQHNAKHAITSMIVKPVKQVIL